MPTDEAEMEKLQDVLNILVQTPSCNQNDRHRLSIKFNRVFIRKAMADFLYIFASH